MFESLICFVKRSILRDTVQKQVHKSKLILSLFRFAFLWKIHKVHTREYVYKATKELR